MASYCSTDTVTSSGGSLSRTASWCRTGRGASTPPVGPPQHAGAEAVESDGDGERRRAPPPPLGAAARGRGSGGGAGGGGGGGAGDPLPAAGGGEGTRRAGALGGDGRAPLRAPAGGGGRRGRGGGEELDPSTPESAARSAAPVGVGGSRSPLGDVSACSRRCRIASPAHPTSVSGCPAHRCSRRRRVSAACSRVQPHLLHPPLRRRAPPRPLQEWNSRTQSVPLVSRRPVPCTSSGKAPASAF